MLSFQGLPTSPSNRTADLSADERIFSLQGADESSPEALDFLIALTGSLQILDSPASSKTVEGAPGSQGKIVVPAGENLHGGATTSPVGPPAEIALLDPMNSSQLPTQPEVGRVKPTSADILGEVIEEILNQDGAGPKSTPGVAPRLIGLQDLIARIKALTDGKSGSATKAGGSGEVHPATPEETKIIGAVTDSEVGANLGKSGRTASDLDGAVRMLGRDGLKQSGADGAEIVSTLQNELFVSSARLASVRGHRIQSTNFAAQIREAAEYLAARVDGVIEIGARQVRANLELFPPDLGRMRVEMTMTDGRSIEARFTVSNAETGALLTRNMDHFTQTLARQGISVEKVQVTVQSSESGRSMNSDNMGRHGDQTNTAGHSGRRGAEEREGETHSPPPRFQEQMNEFQR